MTPAARRLLSRLALCAMLFLVLASISGAQAQPALQPLPALPPPAAPVLPNPAGGGFTLNISPGFAAGNKGTAAALQIVALLTVLTIAPALLMMLTSFVRIVVVLGFVRRALGTQTVPPTQVLVGLSLFLTFFVMAPVFKQIGDEAVKPLMNDQIQAGEAYTRAEKPMREFLFKFTRKSDLMLFTGIAKLPQPRNKDEVPNRVLIPAFMIGELQTSFMIGFLIYIPFLIIDMVVGAILLSMGMMMLPPQIVSLPFKIILFVLVDGWALIIGTLRQEHHAMNQQQVLDIIQESFKIGLMLSFPIMLATLVVGVLVSVFQSVTSIQEQTMVFVPKIVAVFVTMLIFLSWMLTTIMNFTVALFSGIPGFVK